MHSAAMFMPTHTGCHHCFVELTTGVMCWCSSAMWNMKAEKQKMVLSSQPYDYEAFRTEVVKTAQGKDKEMRVRPPHPVTMMIKNVLKGVIELLELPPNPLDQLVHLCGGRDVVAEMTGRKEMMECQSDGKWRCVKRAQDGCTEQALNITVRCLTHARPSAPSFLAPFPVSVHSLHLDDVAAAHCVFQLHRVWPDPRYDGG